MKLLGVAAISFLLTVFLWVTPVGAQDKYTMAMGGGT